MCSIFLKKRNFNFSPNIKRIRELVSITNNFVFWEWI